MDWNTDPNRLSPPGSTIADFKTGDRVKFRPDEFEDMSMIGHLIGDVVHVDVEQGEGYGYVEVKWDGMSITSEYRPWHLVLA